MPGILAGCEIGLRGGEAAEVVLAEQSRGCGIEPGYGEWPRIGEDEARQKWRTGLSDCRFDGEYAIFIRFCAGGVASVEGVVDGVCREDADRAWQGSIQGAKEIVGGDARGEGEACNLGESVNAGVS